MKRMTMRLHGDLAEPGDVGLRLPSGVTVLPNPKWNVGVGAALERLFQIEDILGAEYDLDALRDLLEWAEYQADTFTKMHCVDCGKQLNFASATPQSDGSEEVIGWCGECGRSFRWKRRHGILHEHDIERYFIG